MYDQIAHYYDLTHADLTADIPFVLKLAKQANGSILELGCGSGRLLLPLAQAGFVVTGLDNSMEMLALAQAKVAEASESIQGRVQLVPGDMISFAVNGSYPLIIIPYNTFMHLDSKQALAALKQVKAHLTANGRCFIDLANPFALAATPEDNLLTLEGTVVDERSGDVIVHMAANRVDTVEQVLHITWLYDRSPLVGGGVQRTVVQADYHFRYPHQWELLLREAGFNKFTFLGDYDETLFNETCDRLLILAEPRP